MSEIEETEYWVPEHVREYLRSLGFVLPRRAWSLEKEKQSTKKTKNEDCRTVPCTTFLSGMLDEWRQEQKRLFAKHELKWGPDVPIVSSRVGTHIDLYSRSATSRAGSRTRGRACRYRTTGDTTASGTPT